MTQYVHDRYFMQHLSIYPKHPTSFQQLSKLQIKPLHLVSISPHFHQSSTHSSSSLHTLAILFLVSVRLQSKSDEQNNFFCPLILIRGCLKSPRTSHILPFVLLSPLCLTTGASSSLLSAMSPRRLCSPPLVSILISRASCTMQSAAFHSSLPLLREDISS